MKYWVLGFCLWFLGAVAQQNDTLLLSNPLAMEEPPENFVKQHKIKSITQFVRNDSVYLEKHITNYGTNGRPVLRLYFNGDDYCVPRSKVASIYKDSTIWSIDSVFTNGKYVKTFSETKILNKNHKITCKIDSTNRKGVFCQEIVTNYIYSPKGDLIEENHHNVLDTSKIKNPEYLDGQKHEITKAVDPYHLNNSNGFSIKYFYNAHHQLKKVKESLPEGIFISMYKYKSREFPIFAFLKKNKNEVKDTRAINSTLSKIECENGTVYSSFKNGLLYTNEITSTVTEEVTQEKTKSPTKEYHFFLYEFYK